MSDSAIKILIVDDSAVFRGFWPKLLAADPGIVVSRAVLSAQDAISAVTKSPDIDIVLLDVEMPDMDGLTAIPLLLAARPDLKIIMASSLTGQGSRVTVEALTRGAHDFIQKPSGLVPGAALDQIQKQLIEKINVLGKTKKSSPSAGIRSPQKASDKKIRRPSYILIGSSTGGPQALREVLRNLSSSVDSPIFIVQHMPPKFTTMLAEQLQKESGRTCVEVTHGMCVEPRKIYIAPGDYHMTFAKEGARVVLNLNQEAPENFCRPAVDVMFRSASQVLSGQLLSVVLTGMGEDGKRGCESLRPVGAYVIAQDEASSVVWGMPGAVAKAQLADEVIPLNSISTRIVGMFA